MATRRFIQMGVYTYIEVLDDDGNRLGYLTPDRDELLHANPEWHLTTSPNFHRDLVGVVVAPLTARVD